MSGVVRQAPPRYLSAEDSGAILRQKRSGERESPWKSPRFKVIRMLAGLSGMVRWMVVAHLGISAETARCTFDGAQMACSMSRIHWCGVMSKALRKSTQATDNEFLDNCRGGGG